MRHLLAATCLTPVILFAGVAPLRAETEVKTAITTPIKTSTIKNGAPDDIKITSAGSIKPTAAGVAVTIDTNNNVRNEGTIQFTGASNSTGILANAGVSSNITNTGTITLNEDYTPTDADNDGDIDDNFAQGENRFGIRTMGALTGNILNSGSIKIEGNNSAGILLGGPLNGSLTSSGGIEVVGNNSYGIRAGDVSGSVKVSGGVLGQGAGAVGVALDGNITGALVVQGVVATTGYRSPLPADTDKLDADDLLQSGSAVRVSGSVAGGIIFDAPPPNNSTTDDDEDDDGVKDAQEGVADVRVLGSAPAVQIGGLSDIAVGAVAGQSGYGIVIKGGIRADGVYKGIAANAFVVGGSTGHVNVAGGLTTSGSIIAKSTEGSATAVRIGNNATVPEVKNTGTISASGGGAATSLVQGLAIDATANTGIVRNSGKIEAGATGEASAVAIMDKSGGLTLVENLGAITASATGADKATAIDVSANTSGVTLKQLAVAQNAAAPTILGNVRFGSGNDVFSVADGTVNGNTSFGAGNDSLSLSGDAVYNGNLDFGAGSGTLALTGTSVFNGALASQGPLAVTVNGGTLNATNTGAISLSSLSVTGGSLGVRIGGAEGAHTLYDVSGQASFGAGSKLIVSIGSLAEAEGEHVVISAGELTGASNLSTAITLPFLFTGSLEASEATDEVVLDVRRKNAGELGLNQSESGAYGAVFEALGKDADVEDVFLNFADADQVRTGIQQMLPNHAGGVFEAVTQASRATARFLSDPRPPIIESGRFGFFLQQVAWGTSKDLTETSAYDVTGWGASGGVEMKAGDAGAFGASFSYLLGKDADGTTDNQVRTSQYELAGYWRGNWDALGAFARVSAAHVGLESTRTLIGSTGATNITREAQGQWNGLLWSAAAGASYEMRFGRISLRPLGSIDYYSFREGDYSEENGGDSFNLDVDDRTSDELAANASLSIGYDLAGLKADETFFRVEIEGGRRQILAGSVGSTTARFSDGDDFTLLASERESGFIGKLRLLGGNNDFRISGEVNAEQQDGRAAFAARATLHVGF